MLIVSGMMQDAFIPPSSADHRQRDAGVAAGWLNNNRVFIDFARFLGSIDHRYANTVFDAVGRVVKFQLGDNGAIRAVGNAVQADKRGVADQFRYIIRDFGGGFLFDTHGIFPPDITENIRDHLINQTANRQIKKQRVRSPDNQNF